MPNVLDLRRRASVQGVGFWIYFMVGMKKVGRGWWWKASQRHNELLEQQIEVLRQTNELLKKLVASR